MTASGSTLSSMSRNVLAAVREYRGMHGWRLLSEFAELLAIDNDTRDPAALRHNARAVATLFRERGAEMDVVELPDSAPLVVGRYPAAADAPTLGVYVHYDGQPADASSWRSPPYRPELRTYPDGRVVPIPGPGEPIDDDWRLYARSAADDKAPLIAILGALDALRAADLPPYINLVFCFEGEEESGSPHLREYLETLRDQLRADAWLICDGPVHQTGAPQVVLGVRGYCGFELTIYGPVRELHSGHYGNWVSNPALALAHVLASFKDEHGRVTVPGFYDDTRPPTPAALEALADLPPVEDELLRELGLAAPEVPDSRLVNQLMTPSFNIRGLSAASVGDDRRNVIPSVARASIDIRLAAGDDAERMLRLIREHLAGLGYHVLDREPTLGERREHPRLARMEAEPGYPAARIPVETPIVAHLLDAVRRASGETVVTMPTLGGSVPLHHFTEVLQAPAVILPIANADNSQHAADENIRLGNLWYGVDLWSVLLGTPWPGPTGDVYSGAS
jgi:acetylornithine deacetylase/succinyl-diaminopimelate desuccinylase-like protein